MAHALVNGTLPPGDYRVRVNYAKLPGITALEKQFSGQASVSGVFDGRAWDRHDSCRVIDETPGERIFRVVKVPAEFQGKRWRTVWDRLAAHFRQEGFRFATEIEAVEFADAEPTLQIEKWISVPGSSIMHDIDDCECIAMLRAGGRHRILGVGMLDGEIPVDRCLLLVQFFCLLPGV